MQYTREASVDSIVGPQKQCREADCRTHFPAVDGHFYCVEHDVCVYKGAFDPEACVVCRELVKVLGCGDKDDISTHVARQLLALRWEAATRVFASVTWRNTALPSWLKLFPSPKGTYDDRVQGKDGPVSWWRSQLPAMERGKLIPEANIDLANLVLGKFFGEGVILVRRLADDQVEYYCRLCRVHLDQVSAMEEHTGSGSHQQMVVKYSRSPDLTGDRSYPATHSNGLSYTSTHSNGLSYPATHGNGLSYPASHNSPTDNLPYPANQTLTNGQLYPASHHPMDGQPCRASSDSTSGQHAYPASHLSMDTRSYPVSHSSLDSKSYPANPGCPAELDVVTALMGSEPIEKVTGPKKPCQAAGCSEIFPSTDVHQYCVRHDRCVHSGLEFVPDQCNTCWQWLAVMGGEGKNGKEENDVLSHVASILLFDRWKHARQVFGPLVVRDERMNAWLGRMQAWYTMNAKGEMCSSRSNTNPDMYSTEQHRTLNREVRVYAGDHGDARLSSTQHSSTSWSSQNHSKDGRTASRQVSRVSSSGQAVSSSRSSLSSQLGGHRRPQPSSASQSSWQKQQTLTLEDKDRIMRMLIEDDGSMTLEKLNNFVRERHPKNTQEGLRHTQDHKSTNNWKNRAMNTQKNRQNNSQEHRSKSSWENKKNDHNNRHKTGQRNTPRNGQRNTPTNGQRNTSVNRQKNTSRNGQRNSSMNGQRNISKNRQRNRVRNGQNWIREQRN